MNAIFTKQAAFGYNQKSPAATAGAVKKKRRAGQGRRRKCATAKGGKPQPAQSIHAGHTLPAPGQALCPAAYCTMSPPEGCMVTFSVPSFEAFTCLSCASGSCPSLAFLSL